MKTSVVFSSKTGNTQQLANAVAAALPKQELLYTGAPNEAALAADRLYIGFWTDKGSCNREIAAFLKQVKGKEVFLFGTAGFGGDAAYFEKVLTAVKKHLDRSNTVIGTYMCQGKMPQSVRERYVKLKENPEHPANLDALIKNFDCALSHPDSDDLEKLRNLCRLR